MEAKINIVEKLKDKPQGTKLYSLTYGDCFYQEYTGDFGIECQSQNGVQFNLDEYGKYCIDGECVVFPSKEMRDWSKFFKKEDVLVSNDSDSHIIFKGFSKNDYTTFEGKHWISVSKKRYVSCLDIQNVQDYHIEDNKDAAQTYINTIEKRLDGKLNRKTLEIEKTQPEFKDGDIVFMKGIKSELFANCIFILRSEYKDGDERAFYYAFYNADDKFTLDEYGNTKVHYSLRLATDSEKQQLFDALTKKNKAWDAEKKQIVDLKPNVDELKPFDKVLVKDNPYGSWEPAIFWKKVDAIDLHPYMVIGGKRYRFCEPYEGNEHFLND